MRQVHQPRGLSWWRCWRVCATDRTESWGEESHPVFVVGVSDVLVCIVRIHKSEDAPQASPLVHVIEKSRKFSAPPLSAVCIVITKQLVYVIKFIRVFTFMPLRSYYIHVTLCPILIHMRLSFRFGLVKCWEWIAWSYRCHYHYAHMIAVDSVLETFPNVFGDAKLI